MKWILCFSLLLGACNDAEPPTYAGGGPILPGGSAPSDGAGGAGGFGGQGGAGGGPKGACDNASDVVSIENAGLPIREVAGRCGSLTNVSTFCASFVFDAAQYEECISQCVEENVSGLSVECAACFGALERCGLEEGSSCRIFCQDDSCSASCLDCLNAGGCLESYENCRGLPGDGCPS